MVGGNGANVMKGGQSYQGCWWYLPFCFMTSLKNGVYSCCSLLLYQPPFYWKETSFRAYIIIGLSPLTLPLSLSLWLCTYVTDPDDRSWQTVCHVGHGVPRTSQDIPGSHFRYPWVWSDLNPLFKYSTISTRLESTTSSRLWHWVVYVLVCIYLERSPRKQSVVGSNSTQGSSSFSLKIKSCPGCISLTCLLCLCPPTSLTTHL